MHSRFDSSYYIHDITIINNLLPTRKNIAIISFIRVCFYNFIAQTLKLNTMKKKLQLNKEIVSILDRNSMRQMTKAGASDRCESGLCIEYTVKLCPSDPAICPTVDHMCTASVGDLCPTMLMTACDCITAQDCPPQTQEDDGCVIAKTMDDDCKTQRLCPLTSAC